MLLSELRDVVSIRVLRNGEFKFKLQTRPEGIRSKLKWEIPAWYQRTDNPF